MSASLTSAVYLVAAVLFILALRGLSHPETSRQGNRMGMVGLAAVFVAAAALYAPESFGIGRAGDVHTQSLVEMSLGLAIVGITFSGSLIAFAKLQAIMKGNPITFPMQHQINLGIALLILA